MSTLHNLIETKLFCELDIKLQVFQVSHRKYFYVMHLLVHFFGIITVKYIFN